MPRLGSRVRVPSSALRYERYWFRVRTDKRSEPSSYAYLVWYRYIYTNNKLYMTNMKRLIALLAVVALVLAGCTSKKAEGDETTAAADSTQEVTTQEETTPRVDPEEAKALINKLYTELYVNDNHIGFDVVSELLGDKLNAKLNEKDGEMPVIDYDPFINAQDWDTKRVMSSLTITELSEGLYQVEVEPLKGSKETIQLTVGYDDKGVLKILDIPSNPDISVLQ